MRTFIGHYRLVLICTRCERDAKVEPSFSTTSAKAKLASGLHATRMMCCFQPTRQMKKSSLLVCRIAWQLWCSDTDTGCLVLPIALDIEKGGGHKLCQDFVLSAVEAFYNIKSIRACGERWCRRGCKDPVACLYAQSRHHYDNNHSRLEDLIRILASLGQMKSPITVGNYLACAASNCNFHKVRSDFRGYIDWHWLALGGVRKCDVPAWNLKMVICYDSLVLTNCSHFEHHAAFTIRYWPSLSI